MPKNSSADTKPTKGKSSKPTVKGKPPEVEIFFDARDGGYWYRVGDRYLKLGARDIKMHLRTLGLRDDNYFDGLPEDVWPMWNAQMKSLIDYAGPLAGHRVGVFKNSSGRCFLVTDEPALWDDLPKKVKEPRWFIRFIEALLPDGQHEFFCHWLRIALLSLRTGDFRPGQVVCLAGPSQCGKSLLQTIVTEILGGRSANPFRYMMGETQFNYDLAWSEHWQIEDPASTTDIRTRRMFGSKLKECTVNRDFSIHQKGKDALLLPVFRRVTLSVNDEPENLAVIPPLDASIEDKLFLFKCNFADVGDDRKKTWETVMREIPLIGAWLINEFTAVPPALRDARFGLKSWHHPALVAELCHLSPEARLMAIIDTVLFPDDRGDDAPWTGKSLDLEKQLRSSSFNFEVDKLLRFSSACGTYLARLAKQQPERISKTVKGGYSSWVIKAPPQTNEERDDNGN